jgi:hypothetical protein
VIRAHRSRTSFAGFYHKRASGPHALGLSSLVRLLLEIFGNFVGNCRDGHKKRAANACGPKVVAVEMAGAFGGDGGLGLSGSD